MNPAKAQFGKAHQNTPIASASMKYTKAASRTNAHEACARNSRASKK
jgi:hypothetical protein